jgi:hypothetical protein
MGETLAMSKIAGKFLDSGFIDEAKSVLQFAMGKRQSGQARYGNVEPAGRNR